MTVHAIFEGGVFRPLTPIDLPERCEVEFEQRPVEPTTDADQSEIHRLLSQSFDTGIPDLAARVDEHQP